MTTRYGKRGNDLIALNETGENWDDKKLLVNYECLWTINESSTINIIKMLLEAAMMRVDPWRINQIKTFFDIQNLELIQLAETMNINVTIVDDGTFELSTIPKGTRFPIWSKDSNLFYGLVHILVLSGYSIQQNNSGSKI